MQAISASGFPKLAWLAHVRMGHLTVRHGTWVETGSDFVVEGVWPTDFSAGRFDDSSDFFGSGVVAGDGTIIFVPSLGLTDPLYYTDRDEGLFVCNSLPLLLAAVQDELDPHYANYHHINASMVEGVEGYRPDLPTVGGSVRRLLYRNLVHVDGATTEVDKPLPPEFPDYAAYHRYFTAALAGLVANARSTARKQPLDLFSTQSSGFDSTAVNAVLAKMGFDRVFSNRHGKAPNEFADRDADHQVDDDGGPVCEALGLMPTYIDRRSFESGIADEDVYLSAIEDNGEYNLDPVLRFIERPTVLFSGQYGEVWRPAEIDKPGQLNGVLKRHDLGGQGWSEIRLEAGFVHVPAPFLGARRRDQIARITGSEEMRAWRSGKDYDKPIPARIAVENGVPRHTFGQAKKAAAVQFCPPCVPLGKELRDEYFEFLRRHRLLSKPVSRFFPLVHRINAYIWVASSRHHRPVYYLGRALSRLRGRQMTVPLIWDQLTGTIFCFAVNRRVAALRRRCDLPVSR